jgi:hypothetical protein
MESALIKLVEFLDRNKVRATYGAVAEAVRSTGPLHGRMEQAVAERDRHAEAP